MSAVESCARLEAEALLGARDVQPPSRLSVGFAGVPDEAALEARRLRELPGQVTDRDLDAAAQVDRIAGVVSLGRQHDALGRVLDVEELARRRAVAPQHDLAVAPVARADELADHRRNHVRRVQIEVVARPVQVHRKQHDAVEAVLLAIPHRLHDHHLLRDAVGRVGLFRVAVPDVVFLERNRRELRVRADRAGRDQLPDLGQAALLEHVQPHHRVLEQVAARVVAVGADAADLCRQVDDQVRPRVGQQATDGCAIDQVVVARARDEHARALPLHALHHVASEKSGAAGDDDLLVLPEGAHWGAGKLPQRSRAMAPGKARPVTPVGASARRL